MTRQESTQLVSRAPGRTVRVGTKREPDEDVRRLVKTLTDLLRDRYVQDGTWAHIAKATGEKVNTLQMWANERGVPPAKMGAVAGALGLRLDVVRDAAGAPDTSRRLRDAAARLDGVQVDHLALIAERLADGSLPAGIVEGLAELLHAAPHGVGARAQQHK